MMDTGGWVLVIVAVASIACVIVGLAMLLRGTSRTWRLRGLALVVAPVVAVAARLWQVQGSHSAVASPPQTTVSTRSPAVDPGRVPGEVTGQFERAGQTWRWSALPDTAGTTTALFEPFLPRDDETVLAAIASVARRVYGVDLAGVTPTLTNGTLVFASPDRAYAVMLVKEDTGEVHSMVIRAVSR